MSNSLLNFSIPNNISAPMAMRFSQLLVGDLQTVVGEVSAEVYISIAFLHTSWTQDEPTTMKEFIQKIKWLNQKTSAMALAEKILSQQEVFQKNLSVTAIEAQGLIFQSLTFLSNSRVPFHIIQQLTLEKIKVLCTLKEVEIQPLVLTLNSIVQQSKMMATSKKSFTNDDVAQVLKQAADNTSKALIIFDTAQFSQANKLILSQTINEDDDFEDDDDDAPINISHLAGNIENQNQTDINTSPPIGIEVYNREEATKFAQKIARLPPQEGNAFQKQLAVDLANNSSFRTFSEIPEKYQEILSSLYSRFPHFSDVIDFVAERLALSSCGTNGKPIKLAPILLLGSPGTGKTYFAQELAKNLNLNFIEKDLSITSEAFVIAGMDSGWKNSKPGIIFNSIIQGKTANPLICLNEIDKCSTGDSRNSPLTTLHWLLEPTSSHKFQDEFMPLDIRADHIVWVATANDGHIPDPILSRFEVFNINKPTQEQCKAIAQSVWVSLCSTEFPVGHGFNTELSPEILEQISSVSPRVMRKTLTQMAAKAVTNQRKTLVTQDFKLSMERYKEVEKHFGFR